MATNIRVCISLFKRIVCMERSSLKGTKGSRLLRELVDSDATTSPPFSRLSSPPPKGSEHMVSIWPPNGGRSHTNKKGRIKRTEATKLLKPWFPLYYCFRVFFVFLYSRLRLDPRFLRVLRPPCIGLLTIIASSFAIAGLIILRAV